MYTRMLGKYSFTTRFENINEMNLILFRLIELSTNQSTVSTAKRLAFDCLDN